MSSHDLPPLGRCPQKADNKLHKIFEPSFDWKPAWRQTGNAEHQHSYNRNQITYIGTHAKEKIK